MKTLKIPFLSFLFSFFISVAVSGQIRVTIVAGDHCFGEAVIVPIKVENFDSVASFQLKLSFNSDILFCEGYTDANPQIANNLSGIIQSSGLITIAWHSEIPVNMDGTNTLLDLVFTPKQPGETEPEWFTDQLDSYFKNINNEYIDAEFVSGILNIYEIPEIDMPFIKTVYVGETVLITATVISSLPPVSYLWTFPNGQTSATDPYFESVVLADSGNYTLLAADAVGCADQETIYLQVLPSQSVTENNLPDLQICPNPSDGMFKISLPVNNLSQVDINVINSSGIIIYKNEKALLSNDTFMHLDLSILPDGFYVIELTLDSRKYYGKLILHHH